MTHTTTPVEASSPARCWVSDVCFPVPHEQTRQGGMEVRLTTSAVRSAPAVLGYGTSLAVILAAFNYTGGRLVGAELDPEVDEVARKEYLRKNRRRSIEETINELGEGRGTYWRLCSAVMAA